MLQPEKKKVLNKLKTAKGQLEAIIRMVDDDRYCVDISKQILAVQALLKNSNMAILNQHIRGCVKKSIEQGDGEDKIAEIFDILDKYAK